MSYWGRVIGTILLLLAFKNPIAALIGFAIGYYFDKSFSRLVRENKSQPDNDAIEIKALFMPFLFTTLGYLAKVDGRVSEAEIDHVEAVMKNYGFDDAARDDAIRFFQQGAKQDNHYDDLLQRFAFAVKRKPDVIKVVLEIVIGLAIADGIIHEKEEVLLTKIASTLGIHERIFKLLLAQIKGQQSFSKGNKVSELSEAYQVLGVNETDNEATIKKAYRKLMSEHHPDKLIAQGVPEAAIKIATEKSQVIQAAYEVIKKSRQ
jgi:DnaJ like chaperone protein